MKFLKLCVVSIAVLSQITVYASYAPYVSQKEPIHVSTTSQNRLGSVEIVKNDYSALIEKYTLKWQISGSEKLMESIIQCESSGNPFAHALTSKEDSLGLSQINLLAHTNITKEQATDPDFAINFMAEHIASGDAPRMWYTCYKNFYLER